MSSNLERLGLIKKQEGKRTFDTVRNRLRLVVENINEAEPNDVAYVYSGYEKKKSKTVREIEECRVTSLSILYLDMHPLVCVLSRRQTTGGNWSTC